MRLRSALLTTIALGVFTPTAAYATPPTCNLLVDQAGDGRSQAVPVLSSPALDLLSGDIASGTKTVVGVLRLKTTDTTNDPLVHLGMRWSLAFDVGGTSYVFTLSRAGSGTQVASFSDGTSTFPVGLSVDPTSITWTVRRGSLATLTPGALFSSLRAVSSVFGGNADAMISSHTYTDQHPSCVPAV